MRAAHAQDWEQGFLRGLQGSCLVLPLLSESALRPLVDAKAGVKDNCLLEYEVARRARQAGRR